MRDAGDKPMNPSAPFDPSQFAGLAAGVEVAAFAYGLLLAVYLDDFKDIFRETFKGHRTVLGWLWSLPIILNLALALMVSWGAYRVAKETQKAETKIEEADRRQAAREDTYIAIELASKH